MRRRAQPWLGTLVEIAISDEVPDQQANSACNKAFEVVAQIHALMSFHETESDVSRINRAAIGEILVVHEHTVQVLKMALHLTEQTGGIFDIACAPRLVALGYLPPAETVVPGYSPGVAVIAIETATSIRKYIPGWIDLGGIAKGYAVDCAVQVLKDEGVPSGHVNAGGDLRAFGDLTCPVWMRDPSSPTHVGKEIAIHNRALATSATYFSRKMMNKHVVSPLINGKDGQPIDHDHSITVFAPTCMVADAMTKYVAVTCNPQDHVLSQNGVTALII